MEKELKRPQDVVRYRTSDPQVMLGKYLPANVLKTWIEDITDEDTGEVISIERKQTVCKSGKITQDKLQEIMFAIQAGDIVDVEISDENIGDANLSVPEYKQAFNVEIEDSFDIDYKLHYVCFAKTIPQAIQIAVEFGQMYRHLDGSFYSRRVVDVDAYIIPDDDQCIPEECRKEIGEYKNYFKVTVRREWVENFKMKKSDINYIVMSDDVGEAKERIALYLDIQKARGEINNDRFTIRKAMPFEVDCIVPRKFSELFD